MASEVVDRSANEYPDRIGARPENPLAASFRPYIPAHVKLRELSLLPLIVGTLLGIVFGASSLYLVLKVGLTVSASIPVAVISITIFRVLSKLGLRDATILENNIVQTAGSAGESIAFGIGVTMPAIMILGFDLEITRVMLVAVLGGLLGILMMIPLRRALIVQQHGILKYPEGTACAEVLKAGASAESKAAAAQGTRESMATNVVDESATGGKTIVTGFGIGFLYYGLEQIFKTWKEYPTKVFGKPFEAGSVSLENNPALLGVGYIIGPRIASIMCAGGVLSFLVLIPAIKYFGAGLLAPLAPETAHLIKDMTVSQIQKSYILYIGAGAVAAGGIISLVRSLPVIWSGLKGGLADLRGTQAAGDNAPRTDQDLSMKYVIGGIILLVVTIVLFRSLNMNIVGALLIIAFGFLFVTVSSRLTGEVGSSSNPISGMTVATLLLTCLVFLIVGWTAPPYYVTALSVGAIVCIAASNGGTTSQDLKTGFLVGSTPKYQQIAILVGALASALFLGPILLQLNQSGTVYVPVAQTRDFSFPADFRANQADYEQSGGAPKREKLMGAQSGSDANTYYVWHKTTTDYGPAGRYLVNDQGVPVYLSDPGINGVYEKRPDGSSVQKFTAPKATLMSYIIKGILSGNLPWGLVLLGVMIAVVLEMSGIPSLAFAVGVYLPLSTSSPILVGGMVRWLVDKHLRGREENKHMTEEELVAEGDKSPGVLLSSGYIAGGTLAGVIFAFMNIPLKERLDQFEHWATEHNPFFEGPFSDLLGLIPFIVLTVLLYLAGRQLILAGRKTPAAGVDLER